MRVRSNDVGVNTLVANAVGVWVGEGCDHVLVTGNVVSDSHSDQSCVKMDGASSATRITRNNECW